MANLIERSVETIVKNQTAYGSYVASPNFPTYHYCWIRDGAFIAFSMDTACYYDSARKFHYWVDKTIKRYSWKVKHLLSKPPEKRDLNEYLHIRYNLDGTEATEPWTNKQFDGYGAWLWSLAEHIKRSGEEALIDELKSSVTTIITYLLNVWNEPCYDCWEEFPDKIHTSTLASILGGLNAINAYLRLDEIENETQQMRNFLWRTCLHKNQGFAKYYDPPINTPMGIDGSLLWLVYPFQITSPTNPAFLRTIQEIESKLLKKGVHRYPEDTYYGGGEWIILDLWLAWHYYTINQPENANLLIKRVESFADDNGELPEQIPSDLNVPHQYSPWVSRWGPIAKPLLWSHAMYILIKEICR